MNEPHGAQSVIYGSLLLQSIKRIHMNEPHGAQSVIYVALLLQSIK